MSDESTTITTPVPTEVIAAMAPLERNIAALQIVDLETHAKAKEYGKRLKGMKLFVLDMFKDPKKKAHELHKSMTTSEQKYLQPIEKTMNLLNSKLDAYERAERERAEAEARERQKEADRLEQERTLKEAVAAEEAGDQELAEAIVTAPRAASTVVAQPALADVGGTSSRKIYSGEVVNLLALVNYVHANPDAIGYLQANQTAIDGGARALKENFRLPGVRLVVETSRSFKAD
jgi:DNA-binding protein H-NS